MQRDEIRLYFKYFRVWLIIVAILAVCVIVKIAKREPDVIVPRANLAAPTERVYDYADLLSDEEEKLLREYIAEVEPQLKADFVIVTFAMEVEGKDAMEKNNLRSTYWDNNMMDLADDFWDVNKYGYNVSFEGDGSILIDNRYPGQRGEWLSTSGVVEKKLSSADIDDILYAVDEYYDSNPYLAYKTYIDKTVNKLTPHRFGAGEVIFSLVAAIIVALSYCAAKMSEKQAPVTVTAQQYVTGTPVMKRNSDIFLRKYVTKRRIESSSGGGGGGHHHSSSGASHGGGGHRH